MNLPLWRRGRWRYGYLRWFLPSPIEPWVGRKILREKKSCWTPPDCQGRFVQFQWSIPWISRQNMKHFTQRIMKNPSQKIKKDSDAFFLNQKAGFNPGPIENQFEEPSLMTAISVETTCWCRCRIFRAVGRPRRRRDAPQNDDLKLGKTLLNVAISCYLVKL